LAHNNDAILRNEDRYSHIGIQLQYHAAERWEPLEALGWNEVGFNFYHTQDLRTPILELKRGLTRFDGDIVWRSLNTSDELVLATLVNELIYRKAKAVTDNARLHARLIKLIRVSGMLTEKKHILASLGQDISDKKLAEMIAHRKLERPVFHYGVKVESKAWADIVHKTLRVSSVVISLEKWLDAFAQK